MLFLGGSQANSSCEETYPLSRASWSSGAKAGFVLAQSWTARGLRPLQEPPAQNRKVSGCAHVRTYRGNGVSSLGFEQLKGEVGKVIEGLVRQDRPQSPLNPTWQSWAC